MTLLNPEAKSSELPCWSMGILNYIKEEYKSLEKECLQTDQLFNLPETQARNAGIVTSYLKFHQKTEEFQIILDYAINIVLRYDHRLRRRLSCSAYSNEICKKHLDKYVETEWLKDTGKIAIDGKDVRNIHDKISEYQGKAYTLLDDLKRGMGCMEDSLKKEEKTLEDYTWSVDEKRQGLEDLTYSTKKNLFQAEAELLKTSLKKIEQDISSKKYELEGVSSWLNGEISKKKIQETEELEKKLAKVQRMHMKYFCLEKEISNMLNDGMLITQPYLVLRN